MNAGPLKEKNLSIESMRGIAILLVVIGHVIGSAPDGGMKIDFPSPWRYIYMCIDYIQMPLFTAIAGWVYSLKPVGAVSLGRFAGGKFKRLLVPMATVSTLYFIVQYLVPGTNNKEALCDIWRIYLFPYTIFWYLQSLFLIFIAVSVLDRSGFMATRDRWSIVLAFSSLMYVMQAVVIPYEVPNVFSFKGALDQLPYFVAGVGIQRFGAGIYAGGKKYFIVLAIIGIAVLQLKWFHPHFFPELYKCLLPLWLIPKLFILLSLKWKNRFFIYFGTYAYSIYLFHGFGTSGGRIILSYLGIHERVLVFTVALAVAVFVPIAADRILSRSRLLGMLLLGKPYNKR